MLGKQRRLHNVLRQPVQRFYAATTGTAYLLDRPEPRVW